MSMINAVGSAQDPALQPAAAAARATDAGVEATRKALDQEALEGREAAQPVEQAGEASAPPPGPEPRVKGRLVDRSA